MLVVLLSFVLLDIEGGRIEGIFPVATPEKRLPTARQEVNNYIGGEDKERVLRDNTYILGISCLYHDSAACLV